MNPVELKLFSSRVAAICDEMGLVLRRAAFSPNIKDRLDFSCALFGPGGELFAQAAHIPVHLGSMAFAMGSLVRDRDWREGDMLVVNDPYLGGTHLPDVTLIAPVFDGAGRELAGFVANRAHHANIGCDTPGSMPVSRRLDEEGEIISPVLLISAGEPQRKVMARLPGLSGGELSGDFAAQAGANRVGAARLRRLVESAGPAAWRRGMAELNDYAERIAASAISELAPGRYRFGDVMDDDGAGSEDIPLKVLLTIAEGRARLDFSGSAPMVPGNLNCPESVAAAASYYCFRCLMPDEAPACEGLFRRIEISTRSGTIVNAVRPAAVAAGNVETSTRLVDLVLGALAQARPGLIPAASQGTMNNIAMGRIDADGGRWDYYETLAGGLGAGPRRDGLDCVHSHMTNTLNTPVESLEMHYPLRIRRYGMRRGSGGQGARRGGNGVVREYEFLEPARLSLLTERRRVAPWGLNGGGDGAPGENLLNGRPLPGKCSLSVGAGDRLLIRTPGGGGWGAAAGAQAGRRE